MDDILNFIVTNYRLIIEVVILIISVVVFILRKKPVSDILSQLYGWIIVGVNNAEKTDLKGADKLDHVVTFVMTAFHDKYGQSAKLPCSIAYIEFLIESILSTPQKKDK